MMCNQKKSCGSRCLRPLLLLPALGAAVWLANMPTIASVIHSVSESSLLPIAVSTGKVTNLISENGNVSLKNSLQPSSLPASLESNEESVTVKKPIDIHSEKSTEHQAFDDVEKMAEFPGGMKDLMGYLAANIHAPNDDTPSGRVIVRFVVEANGEIGNAEIVKGLSPSMDAEALRVVKSMPRWIPAEVGGKAVASNFVLPVSYKAEKHIPHSDQGREDGVKSRNISTSVSTSTNSSGETETTTIVISTNDPDNEMSVSITTSNENEKKMVVYVDGKRYDGKLSDIPSSKVESMSIDNTDNALTVIRITLKK